MSAMSSKAKVHVGLTGNSVSTHILPKTFHTTQTFFHEHDEHPLICADFIQTMTTLLHAKITTPQNHHHHHHRNPPLSIARETLSNEDHQNPNPRRKFIVSTTTLLATTSLALVGLQQQPPPALAESQKWGTRSFIREKFFEPGLSPEDAAARIRQTAEGLHSLRHMLETMSWRYVIKYLRLKSSYLSQDLKNAMTTLPDFRRKSYVEAANVLVDNMAEFDYYVRTPKIYESYLYYEKTLKSIDDVVALL